MASDYPVSVPSHTVKTNGVDIIDADHINAVQDDITAITNFIGASGAVQSHSAAMLALLQGNYTGGQVHKKSNTEIYVEAISAIVNNLSESIREIKRITTQTTLTASELDTGTFSQDAYYDIFICGGNAATSPVFKICLRGNTPSGYSIYKKIGWLFNEAAGSLSIAKGFLGNYRDGSDNPNIVKAIGTTNISTSSTSYVDMDDMTVRFVSNGRPVRVIFTGVFLTISHRGNLARITIDGTEKMIFTKVHEDISYYDRGPGVGLWLEVLPQGEHTIKVQWKLTSSGTWYQYGETEGNRVLMVEEL